MRELCQKQRAMRAIRRSALQKGVVGVLDLGSSNITCLVLEFGEPTRIRDDGVGRLAGQADFRIIGQGVTRSRGITRGEIETMAEAERAVRTVVAQAQKMAGRRIDHIIVSISGGRPASYGLEGQVDLQQGTVTEACVARALASCQAPDFGRGREVLHAQPVNFAVDQRSGLVDPRDHAGNNLAVDMHALTVDAQMLGNLVQCLRRCDLELAGVAAAGYVSGLAALVENERNLGAACIDLGGGTTGVSIFMRQHMIFADAVRMGGNLITSDIAQGLRIPIATAERLKTLSGGVEATGRDDREMLEVSGDETDWADKRMVSRADLIAIMRPRVEEILENVRDVLDAAGFDAMPARQIVLTGGSSQIPGLDVLASRILGQNVRCGRPIRLAGTPAQLSVPGCSAAVGLALFAAHPQDEWWDFEMPADAFASNGFRRAIGWFRDNW